MPPKRQNNARAARANVNESPAGPSSARQNPKRSTRSVIPNSMSSEEDDMGVNDMPNIPGKSPNPTSEIMVSVPKGQRTSDYTTLSSASSREDSVFDKGSNVSCETPGTTTNPTPAESEAASSSRRPNKRVNASERAAALRNSSFALGSGTNGNKKRSADALADEGADAAMARAMQEDEYRLGDVGKKQKVSQKGTKDGRKAVIEDSADDSEDYLSELSDLSPVESLTAAAPAPKPKNRRKHTPVPPVDLSSESELSDVPDDYEVPGSDIEMRDLFDHSLFGEGSESLLDLLDDDDDRFYTEIAPGMRPPERRRAVPPRRRARQPHPRLTRAQRERKKLEDRHPIVKSMWKDLGETPPMTAIPDPQPSGITRRLKPFQLEGLNWMRRQEQTDWKGGLLGDEMGMGKTIQAVSLLMSDYPAGKPSLVVVPPVALMQWSSEISSYTDGKLNVLVHHNSNFKVKSLTTKDLKAYDVIMISYSGLESLHRKEVKGWNRNNGLVKEDSVIHSIDYHRLILDEAHNIKQRTTGVARACFALKSTYKWCLSGTPVQNRIGEFFSLLRFLEAQPFACYFCKSCDCRQLHWSQDVEKRCTYCRHSGFHHVSIFNQEILNPITESLSPEKRKEALAKLRSLTDRIMLRRVKKDHTSSMELPPKRIEIHNEFFGEIERDFSSSIMTNSARQFDTYVSRGVMLNNYANIFGLIMQMRQVANHPDLILKKNAEGGQNVLVCSICDEPAEEAVRSRCHHEFCRQCVKDYVTSFESGGQPDCPRCHIPLSIDFEQPDIDQHDEVKKNSIINRIRMDDWTSSTKIEMLVYDLYKLRSKKQTHKSIVFSQFTSMLQLVEWRLRRVGINTVMLDGSMSPAQRQKSIDYFMDNVNVEVFLVSLKAGGIALNLTEASRVFIVDPWWNPAAEWQSADRCHRIGQRRPCVIKRLCIEDSVESRMVMLQEKKANMINGTLNKDQSEALEKLTPQDMEFLFRGG